MPLLPWRRRRLAPLLPLLLLAPAAGHAASPQFESTLPNGLHVLVRSRADAALVSVAVVYPAGAAAEPDSLTGLAHLAEHLVCTDAINRELTLATVHWNASTSPRTMQFESVCLPGLLPRVLAAEAARMAGVDVDSLAFARERAVVLQELAYRGVGQRLSAQAEAFRLAFPDHPYGRSVGGTPESVRRITPADAADYLDRSLQPHGASLLIEGPIDVEAVADLVRERFAGLAVGPAPLALPPYPPVAAAQSILDDPDHDGYRVATAVRVPLDSPRDLALLDLGLAYLEHAGIGVGWHRIAGEAVVTCAWYGSYRSHGADWGLLERRRDPDRDAQSSLGWHWERLQEAVRDLGAAARRTELDSWLDSARSGPRVIDPVEWLPGIAAGEGGAVPTVAAYGEILAGVALADVQGFLAETFTPARATVAVSHGRDSGRLAARRLAGRAGGHEDLAAADGLAGLDSTLVAPVLAQYAAVDVPGFSVLRLGNGVPVVCLHRPGATHWDLRGWRGLAPPAAKLPVLCRLYGQVAAYEPRSMGEDPPRPWPHDASFGLAPDGVLEFAAAGPAAQAAAVAAAVVRRLDEPRFNTAAWATALERGPETCAHQDRVPAVRAWTWRLERILGEKHPAVAARRADGRAFARLVYADLEKLHRTAAGGTGRTTLLAVGGVPPGQVRAVLDAAFGRRGRHEDWTAGTPPRGPDRPVGSVVTAAGRQDVLLGLSFPAVRPGPGWPQPGLTLLWCEEAVSRALDARLRQQEGWTYGASCTMTLVAGWVVPEIHVTCHPGQAPAVLAEVRGVLRDLAAAGPDADAAARARLQLVRRLVHSAEDPDALEEWLRVVTAFGPPPDRPVAAAAELPGAGPEVFAMLVPPDRFAFTAVGAILEDDLELFGD